jgi:hypothetical protein
MTSSLLVSYGSPLYATSFRVSFIGFLAIIMRAAFVIILAHLLRVLLAIMEVICWYVIQ